jgi:ABC-type iron transport system FetAB permease component
MQIQDATAARSTTPAKCSTSMPRLNTYRRALIVLAAATLADFTVRFVVNFDTSRVVSLEAVLFLVASAVLLWAARRDKADSLNAQRLDLWLALAFGLAALRAALWASGIPVYVANLVILVLGIVLGAGFVLWSRRAARESAGTDNKH